MNKQEYLALALSGVLLSGCLAGCSVLAASPDGVLLRALGATSSTVSSESSLAMTNTAYALEDCAHEEAALREQLKGYERFGMTYDPVREELRYQGKLVRWFEDYYQLREGEQAGIDFFDENGVVDVYAVRDFSSLEKNPDGSFDPSGKVVGLKEFTKEEFAARDIAVIKNPPTTECYEGELLTQQERQEIAAEYAPFGVTYDASADQWYYKGEKVRYFLDLLISNGESLKSGAFRGTMRNSWHDGGTVDIYTVRDYDQRNQDGNGTLTAVEKYSQQEFDARTQENAYFEEGPGELQVASAN